jgi:DNA-binding IclR family transcriptional regulator
MKTQILELLERSDMTAEEVRRRVGVGHARLYTALVQLEAEGRVEVVPVYADNRRTTCLWRNCMEVA